MTEAEKAASEAASEASRTAAERARATSSPRLDDPPDAEPDREEPAEVEPEGDEPVEVEADEPEPADVAPDSERSGHAEPDSDVSAEDDNEVLDPVEPLEATETPQRRRSAVPGTTEALRRSQRRLALSLLLLLAAAVALSAAGLDLVWDSTAGRYVTGLQPTDEGYVALVTPSPTLLVLTVHDDPVGEDPELTGAALLSLHPGEGGAVVVMPAATVLAEAADLPDLPGDDAETLAGAYRDGGASAVQEGMEGLFELAIAETVEVTDDGWASLTRPVEPITLASPDPVGERWPAGTVEIAADEVGELLWVQGEEESELVRVSRHRRFWEAWLSQVADSGPEAVPGEVDTGIGLFVDRLASADLPPSVIDVPMTQANPAGPGGQGEEYLVADSAALAGIVAAEVPFPQESEPGARIRISLLNGTTDVDVGQQAVSPLVEAGAEVAITGNADSFEEPSTLFLYTDPALRSDAQSLRNALGTGRIELREAGEGDGASVTDEGERIDVTVILGADAPRAIRRLETTG